MRREQRVFFSGCAAQQVKILEAWNAFQIGVALFPDGDEIIFAAQCDLEAVHGDIHIISPLNISALIVMLHLVYEFAMLRRTQ
jgi:hypothetical protein